MAYFEDHLPDGFDVVAVELVAFEVVLERQTVLELVACLVVIDRSNCLLDQLALVVVDQRV